MKRYLPILPIILFPYVILFILACIFSGFMQDTFAPNDGSYLFLILLVFYIVALICAILSFITSLTKKRQAQDILRINMTIKVIHIPAYVLIFLIGIAMLITIFTMGISIALMILDGMTILLTGLIGLGGVIRGLFENKLSKRAAIIHAVLQFVFCADVISSIVMYRAVKKA